MFCLVGFPHHRPATICSHEFSSVSREFYSSQLLVKKLMMMMPQAWRRTGLNVGRRGGGGGGGGGGGALQLQICLMAGKLLSADQM